MDGSITIYQTGNYTFRGKDFGDYRYYFSSPTGYWDMTSNEVSGIVL